MNSFENTNYQKKETDNPKETDNLIILDVLKKMNS